MQSVEFLKMREHPELAGPAAEWFHQKWGVPLKEYQESIAACLQKAAAVPQWYLALEGGRIIGGLGVIEMTSTTAPTSPPTSAPSMWRKRTAAAALRGSFCGSSAAT